MSDNPLPPIKRLTSEDRVIAFQKASNSIYNKFTPYDRPHGYHFSTRQPYVWTKINDSNLSKNLTKYDNQAFPIGSTIRDVKRMAKFMASGTGLLFIGKQSVIQKQSAFNETRAYNPLSVLAATAAPGSTGLIKRPTRFIESNGTAGDAVAGALLSLVGIQGKNSEGKPPAGAADGSTLSNQARVTRGAEKGLIRFETGRRASTNFNVAWAASSDQKSGGLLQKLGSRLVDKLKSTIISTIPFLSGVGGRPTATWSIRPEYLKAGNGSGPYEAMLSDSTGLLSIQSKSSPTVSKSTSANSFFNNLIGGLKSRLSDTILGQSPVKRNAGNGAIPIGTIHRYYPGLTGSKENWYTKNGIPTDDESLGSDKVTDADAARPQKNILHYQVKELKSVVDRFQSNPNKKSTERFSFVVPSYGKTKDYNSIPDKENGVNNFEKSSENEISLKNREFSRAPKERNKIGTADTYNMLLPFRGDRIDGDGDAPEELRLKKNYSNSKDIIYFYFYDIINSKYIPFRATINSLNDVHSADWDEVSYLGRADKLYIYKGFTREVNLGFTVYANSLKELTPMWKRINYLVGLTRPSKYTNGNNTTDQFMYPPMTTFRIGDMYVDQPAVLKSVSLTVPEHATWETQRGKGPFNYLEGVTGITFSDYNKGKDIYQLPTIVDITVNMSIMEKSRSIVDGLHFFPLNDGRATDEQIASRGDGSNPARPNGLTTNPTFLGGVQDRIDVNRAISFNSFPPIR